LSQQTPVRKPRLPPAAIAAIAMAAVAAIALYIRIALPYDQVFGNGHVWFLETDSYYYMRNIQVIVQHFPHFNTFDPYMVFPGGQATLIRPFFAQLIATAVLLVRGASSLYRMETVAAYMPAILGTLALIPVYFIGKELFNRWVGVISALLVAILPTEFLHRSLLGFLDHHVAEVLFSTTAVLFLIMAVKRARDRDMSFSHVLKRDWSIIRRPLIYTLLAGIFLGFYLLTWQGGLYFVFILFAYLVIQFLVDHLTHRSADYLCIIGTPLFLIAFLMLLPVLTTGSFDNLYRIAMTIAILVPIIMALLSRFLAGRNLRPVYYPLALAALLGIGLGALHAINPTLFAYIFKQFNVFTPAGAMLTVMEVHPLTVQIAWANFNTSFFIAFISFGMLIYVAIKERGADKILFLVWSIVTLIAVFGQRRFGYYYAINAGLLTGYFTWKMLDLVGLRRILNKPKERVVEAVKKFKKKGKKARERQKPKTFMQPRGAWVNAIIVGIVLFFLVIFPSTGTFAAQPTGIGGSSWFAIGYTPYIAELPNQIMTAGWYDATSWLLATNNVTGQPDTPDPFGDPDFYYELYPPKSEFQYPASAYGVMSWWDYGYFIMQIGHRIPNANPGQTNAAAAGKFFTDTNVPSANAQADKLGAKYIVIDYLMATTAKFYAMADWAGSSSDNYYGLYYIPPQTGQTTGQFTYLYYPAYYQSMVARLYFFDGQAQNGTQPVVISYDNKTDSRGFAYRQVTSAKSFDTYEEAQAYLATQTSGNWKIVGGSAFTSILPLEAVTDYQLVHSTGATTSQGTVKVFQYLGGS
jgi:oligosaccharyl transferase (archaeosortase A-associated)